MLRRTVGEMRFCPRTFRITAATVRMSSPRAEKYRLPQPPRLQDLACNTGGHCRKTHWQAAKPAWTARALTIAPSFHLGPRLLSQSLAGISVLSFPLPGSLAPLPHRPEVLRTTGIHDEHAVITVISSRPSIENAPRAKLLANVSDELTVQIIYCALNRIYRQETCSPFNRNSLNYNSAEGSEWFLILSEIRLESYRSDVWCFQYKFLVRDVKEFP